MLTKHLGALTEFKLLEAPGQFRAVFSLFDTKDSDGDVTRVGAFKDGSPVRIAQWGHNWGGPAIGKGIIHADESKAWVDGEFFLGSQAARDTYEAVKGLGALQQWSYGYDVLASAEGEFKGEQVRFLDGLEVHEVSPVMLGAQPLSHTESVKGAKRWGSAPAGSYEELANEISDAYAKQLGTGWVVVSLATFPDRAIVCSWKRSTDPAQMDSEDTYWSVPYSRNADGTLTLGTALQVDEQIVYVPAKARVKALAAWGSKAAIKPHKTATSDGAWDGSAMWARLPAEAAALRAATAWVDPAGDAAVKGSYRFIHHEVAADGTVGAANLTACSTGIGVLNGGRSGTTIPDADKAGVWRHLAKHITDSGAEAPELKLDGGAKVGARNSASDLELIQQMHDTSAQLGAACSGKSAAKAEEPVTAKAEEPKGLTTFAALVAVELLEHESAFLG